MEPVSIFDDYSWNIPFRGKTCIYRLRWGGKEYIGGTDWIYRRMKDWRRHARVNALHDLQVQVLLVCYPEDKEKYEKKLIELYNTFVAGHNKTSTGSSAGRKGIHPNTKEALLSANLGRVLSKDTREKIGRANSNPTDETRRRKSEAAKRRWSRQKGVV